MRMNHRLLFWGLGFLSAGLVALAIQQNLLDRDVMASAWRLWPLILVAVGVSLILSRTPYALVGTALSAIVIGITVSGIAFGTNLGDSNLSHDGDTWESSTYTSAEHKITLTVHGNAASFDLNPTGGC